MNLQQQEKNVLHFSDLSLNVVQSDLEMFLSAYKQNIVVISLDQKTQSTDYQKFLRAKVIFKDSASANKVRLEQNLKKIKGHSVRIMWDERDSSIRYNTKSNLFIKGIPESTTPREVYEYFMKFGDISSLKIPEDENGSHHGYGYITYYNPEDAENVLLKVAKENVFGVKLEVSHFQRRNERNFEFYSSNARSLYIRNFPDNYKEDDLKKLCSQHGEVEKIIIHQGTGENNYGIATFISEEETRKALESLSGVSFGEKRLFVQPLQNKYERKQFIQNQIRESNIKLNEQYHLCNLHIRNIPYNATEEDLRKTFEKFGNIKSLKIEKFILETKESDKLKEIPTSKGFGYLCYDNQESAKKAIEEFNGKYLEGFESWNRPILIDYFMPKQQRMIYANQLMGTSSMNNMPYPMIGMPFNMGMMPPQSLHMRVPMPGYMPRNQPPRGYYQQKQQMHRQPHNKNAPKNQQPKNKPSLIDMNVLNSLETEESKRDYLGEIIFKAIEESPVAAKNNMTIDTISKITGMIIGIANLDEVIATVQSESTLYNRIEEGLNLLKTAEQQNES